MRTVLVVRDVLPPARHTDPAERPEQRFAFLSRIDPSLEPVEWARRRDRLFRREQMRTGTGR